MAICKICNKEVDLRTHIRTHKISAKDYYDKYLKNKDEGICPVCGNQSKFISVGQGYHHYCSNVCQQKSKETQEKRVKTEQIKRQSKKNIQKIKAKQSQKNLQKIKVKTKT